MIAVVLLAAGCGGSDRPVKPPLTVAAGRSLEGAFTAYARRFRAHLRYVPSADIAGQVQGRDRADVIAAVGIPRRLVADGLIERPRVFATNKLVLVTLAGGRRVRSVDSLADPGARIAVPPATTIAGQYARRLVARLPAATRAHALANLRGSEHAIDDVLAGRADAAIAYFTAAHRDGVIPLDFPDELHPRVTLEAAVVTGAPADARAFVRGLRRQAGRTALVQAGLTPR